MSARCCQYKGGGVVEERGGVRLPAEREEKTLPYAIPARNACAHTVYSSEETQAMKVL